MERVGRNRVSRRRNRQQLAEAVQHLDRKIPYYNLLDEDALNLIEEHADRILAEVGIEIRGDKETIELFRDAGATVDGERLRFDPGLVSDIVTRSVRSPSGATTRFLPRATECLLSVTSTPDGATAQWRT